MRRRRKRQDSKMMRPQVTCDEWRAESPSRVAVAFKPANKLQTLTTVILYCLSILLFGSVKSSQTQVAAQVDYQISAQVAESTKLLCNIGNPAFCGAPYFIAWYKYNSNSWHRVSTKAKHSNHQSSCNELPSQLPSSASGRQHQFKCTSLGLEPVELADEGQYKCEVTYKETLDSDKCPPFTINQLNVLALPSEPEIKLNGRAMLDSNQVVSLKEGAQVRLECQSTGGKPAPRIEWLNVSESRSGEPEVMLLHLRWPQKKSNQIAAVGGSSQPLSSAAVSVSLSRYDLNVRFACLVQVAGGSQYEEPLERLVGPIPAPGFMLKWIKLDVQVRPKSVELSVFHVDGSRPSNQLVQPLASQEQSSQLYSLQPNRLYAIQCQVAQSRPRSQVSWFNRSTPVQLEQVELEADLSELAGLVQQRQYANRQARLSSFVRTISHADGTFSTLATLILRTSLWDAPEELICRPSNEAFEQEDLIQVAPIVTARLSVNYPPVALLERAAGCAGQLETMPDGSSLLRLTEGRPLVLRCSLVANPIAYNAIVQIEWTFQGRKLQAASKQPGGQTGHPIIERPNHLHMPQGLPTSRLLHTSQLSILSSRISDAGSYGCLFKLIPAANGYSAASSSAPASAHDDAAGLTTQTSSRITSGQANRTIQVHVIEATSGAPTLRIRTAAPGLQVYGPRNSRHLTAVLPANNGRNNLSVSLWCDTGAITSSSTQSSELVPKVQRIVWYHNGVQLHSNANTNTYNLSLLHPEVTSTDSGLLGTYSCAQQYVQGPTSAFQASQLRYQASRNQVEVRVRAGPKLIERRQLMPTWRGFSLLELLENSEQRLRLSCSAQCEPLCSIDWLIDGRLIERPPTSWWATNTVQAKWVRVPMAPEVAAGGESLYSKDVIKSRQNDSTGVAWTRSAALLASGTDPNLPMGDTLGPGNVHSSLELSYRQIARLFGVSSPQSAPSRHQLPIKCVINGSELFVSNQFGQVLVGRGDWFPPRSADASDTGTKDEENELTSDLLRQAINSKSASMSSDDYYGLQYGSSGAGWWNTGWPTAKDIGLDLGASGPPDEMQISLVLDGPPSQVSLTFSGSMSSSAGSGASITESQLLELLSPERPTPALTCTALSQSPLRFRWTFVDLNGTQHQLASDSGQLSLRQLVESSRHKMGLDLSNQAASVGLVVGLVGNYTCTAWNEFGSSSDSLVLRFQGRPICNLSVGSHSGLRCSVYSNPSLLETVWFKDNQQVALNRSALEASSSAQLEPQSPLWFIDLPLELSLDEAKSSNFRCIARNPLGYSATCELGFPVERSIAQLQDAAPRQTPPMSMITIPDVKHIDGLAIRLLEQSAANLSGSVFQQVAEPASGIQSRNEPVASNRAVSLLQGLLARIDWLLLAAGLLTISWLLFLVASSFARRRFAHFYNSKQQRDNHHTNWSFRTSRTANSLTASSPGELLGQTTSDTRSFLKPCAINYYGSSNADSERDMVQSCSQSSHYDADYELATTTCAGQPQFPQHLASQQQQQRLLAQPLYFNAPSATLLNRRNATMKQSMSSSSTMGAEQLSGRGIQKRDLANRENPSTLVHTSNQMPLINGKHNSRINIDQPQYSSNHLQNQPLRLEPRADHPLRTEHIYDRVIYGQMIL